jgi:hypothetical protein
LQASFNALNRRSGENSVGNTVEGVYVEEPFGITVIDDLLDGNTVY